MPTPLHGRDRTTARQPVTPTPNNAAQRTPETRDPASTQPAGWQAKGRTPAPVRTDPAAGADPAAAAKAFDTARTPESFRAWADASPAGAALWLKSVARAAGNTDAIGKLDTILQAPKEKGADVAALFAAVHATPLGGPAAAPAADATNTWYTPFDPNAKGIDPPSLTGKLTMQDGKPTLNTAFGNFTIANQANFDGSHTLGGVDSQAFNNRVVTVRGWPDADWKPGTNGTLSVEEFSPGTSPDYVSGRVTVANDDVFVQVRADKKVKITDPALREQLKNYDALGVVLPGAPSNEGGTQTYAGKPDDYYVLAGFSAAGEPKVTGDQVSFTMQLAHGKTIECTMPKESWDKTERQQRHYFMGHFENGQFKAQGLTPTAGPFVSSGTPSKPSMDFIERAIPVTPPVYSANDAQFGLR